MGSGYVGLVTGVCLADGGHQVLMVDVDVGRIAGLLRGEVPFFEPGLERLLHETTTRGRIDFTTDAARVSACDLVFLAVPTPSADDGSCDTSILLKAAAGIAPHLQSGAVVVIKSTVSVGTTEKVEAILEQGCSGPVRVAMNPEFLREGTAVRDFQRPDRVVVGTRHESVHPVMESLYAGFLDDDHPLIMTDPRSAELCKYAANAYLAMRIAFINEIAGLTEAIGADIDSVRRAMGADWRIGAHYLHPGPGYGGTCFPKDVQALAHIGRAAERPMLLADATHAANRAHRDWVIARIRQALGPELAGRRLALWGLSFKANSDDVRESIAVQLLRELGSLGLEITVFDPQAGPEQLGSDAAAVSRFAVDPLDAARGADVVALLTEWPQFAVAPLDEVCAVMRGRVLVDARNLLRPAVVRRAGLEYQGIGRR